MIRRTIVHSLTALLVVGATSAAVAPAASAGDVVPQVTRNVVITDDFGKVQLLNCNLTVRLYAPWWGGIQALSSATCSRGSFIPVAGLYGSNGISWQSPGIGTSPQLFASPTFNWGGRGTRWHATISGFANIGGRTRYLPVVDSGYWTAP